jgi:hypothetical protein
VSTRRRWFQLSLRSLFLLTLLVGTFFAGYTTRAKQEEAERRRAELEAQRTAEEARLKAEAQRDVAVVMRLKWLARQQPPGPGPNGP